MAVASGKGLMDIVAGGLLAAKMERPLSSPRPHLSLVAQVHLLSYSDGRGGGAMLWRIHHSIGDGISLASLLLSLADGGAPPLPSAHPFLVLRIHIV